MTSAPFWIASLLMLAAPAKAPPPERQAPPADCRDVQGVDRCSADGQRRVRELFGVGTIEAHRDSGDQVRRAFYVDGYGRDVLAIVFIRPKGGDPSLSVHFPREPDGKRSEPLRVPVPNEVWEDVIRRSSHFDKQLHPPPEARPDPEVITLCIHSWVFTVEAADPAEGNRPAELRRRTEDACDNGLTEAYANELQRAAVPLLPHCARLDRSQHRNEATLLSACRLLRGDRMAAAEVMNRLDRFRFIDRPEDSARLGGLFASDARIDWAGEPLDTAGGAEVAWARKMAEGEVRTVLYYDHVEGESADRVRFVGLLSRAIEDGERYLQAPVEQIWVREGGDFEIERATVGPFEPEPAATEPLQ